MHEKVITPTPTRDLTDEQFGCWTVLAPSTKTDKKGRRYWHIRCRDCGRESHRRYDGLLAGTEISCRCKRTAPIKHGHSRREGQSKEFMAWMGMKARCEGSYLPCFPNYGGRGITVYEPWLTRFDLFLAEVGPAPSPEHSIDRIDVNRGYEPGNIRWATQKEQCRNKTNNRLLTCESLGLTMTVAEWSERQGFTRSVIPTRLKKGWSVERALTEPFQPERKRRTHCRNGHEFTPENTVLHHPTNRPRPVQVCRTCRLAAARAHKAKIKGLAEPEASPPAR